MQATTPIWPQRRGVQLRRLALRAAWTLLCCAAASCNLDFEETALGGLVDSRSDAQSDGTSDGKVDTTVLSDADVVRPDSVDAPMDTQDDGFSAQNCALALAGVEGQWECVGAPNGGVSMLGFDLPNGDSGVVVVNKVGDTLVWHPYVAGAWWPPFVLGAADVRPLVGVWHDGDLGGEGPAIARRGTSELLDWSFRSSFGAAAIDVPTIAFATANGAKPFTGNFDDDGFTDLVVYYPTKQQFSVRPSSSPDTPESFVSPQTLDPSPSLQQVLTAEDGFAVPTFALYKSGLLQLLSAESVPVYAETTVADGAAAFADIDPISAGSGVELLVCVTGFVDIYSMPSGEHTNQYALATGATCLPGVERVTARGSTLLAYLSTAGVMLRRPL